MTHKKLDDAVLDAYGWPRDLGDEEILARLLALNLERAAGLRTEKPAAGEQLNIKVELVQLQPRRDVPCA